MKLNGMDIFQIFSKKIIKSLLVIGNLWKGRRKAVQHKKYLEKNGTCYNEEERKLGDSNK